MTAGQPGWSDRMRSLHAELTEIAEPEAWWWVLAAAAAYAERLPRAREPTYLSCDAEPDADTLIAYRAAQAFDVPGDAIRRARAARTAITELHGTLPGQPLAVTLSGGRAARGNPSGLRVAAFAFGHRCVSLQLDDPNAEAQLRAAMEGASVPLQTDVPFVCVSLGSEPLATARHGHRRAWTSRGGPWLGLGRAADVAIVSTSHVVVDGYGHARITARVAELATVGGASSNHKPVAVPAMAPVPGAVPLSIAWRDLTAPLPRVIPLAYQLGIVLHRQFGTANARFSPSIQIPVALGAKSDPDRLRRRVVAASVNVRLDGHQNPEPFALFEKRVRALFAREAMSEGLSSRLLAAARGVPVPLGWKRRSLSAKRPPWLERFADMIGGRALLSRISIDTPIPLSYAVSSPSRMASAADPIGGCVLSLVDDKTRGTITLTGSGQLADVSILDALLSAPLPVLSGQEVAAG